VTTTRTAGLSVGDPALGARWITTAFVVVGAVNYGYAVVLTRLLDVHSYTVFAAGQSLLLAAAQVATACVPWVLAQALAQARSEEDRSTALQFASLTSSGIGVMASLVVVAISAQFAPRTTTVVLGISTVLIFLRGRTTGWLQGDQRMRPLAALTVGEVLVKVVVGLMLVLACGLQETGALAGFGCGALLLVLWGPGLRRQLRQPWRRIMVLVPLWKRVAGIATVQLLMALLVSIDVVLVAMLPADPSAAASYQASVIVSRVPLFLASAVSVAYFPELSRRAPSTCLEQSAARLYLQLALPVTAVLATAPPSLLGVALPPEYGLVGTFIAVTALTGASVGAVNLLTTFYQARSDWTGIRWQVLGVVGYTSAALAGWALAGIVGLALGALVGALIALVLIGVPLTRRQAPLMVRYTRLIEPTLIAALLVAVRPLPYVWLLLAAVVAVRVSLRFMRPVPPPVVAALRVDAPSQTTFERDESP
jgi:O-antigen/teichoic acid export membrane protein